MENSDSHKVAFEEALKCLSEFNMSRALKSEQKEAIFTLVLEKIHWSWCQLALESLILQVLVCIKETFEGSCRLSASLTYCL